MCAMGDPFPGYASSEIAGSNYHEWPTRPTSQSAIGGNTCQEDMMARAIYYVRRWAWLLILCPILAGGVTLAVVEVEKANQPPVYEASTSLIFGIANPGGPGYVPA